MLQNFYNGNLLPFYGNTVILCYKAVLPWKLPRNDNKLPRYCFKTLAPDKRIPNTTIIHCHFLTIENEGTMLHYSGI